MKIKYTDGITMPLVLLVLFVIIGGALIYRNSTLKPLPVPKQEAISAPADLNAAADELDRVDIDGLGNELPQISNDSTAF